MSLPTAEELARLAAHGDSEMYHSVFDALLEAKLDALDPEWMAAMRALYKTSGLSRWYS